MELENHYHKMMFINIAKFTIFLVSVLFIACSAYSTPSVDTNAFRVIENREGGFHFLLPSDWSLDEGYTSKECDCTLFISPKTDGDEVCLFCVVRVPMPAKYSTNTVFENFTELINPVFAYSEEIHSVRLPNAKKGSKKTWFAFEYSGEGGRWKGCAFATKAGTNSVIIPMAYAPENIFKKYNSDIQTILKSFTVGRIDTSQRAKSEALGSPRKRQLKSAKSRE